ncbi:MAG: ABC transporter ATP-binding protein [Alphaproteobacteria bacterium]|nr:ABC transporter ATP-binding protein [Alphaproteobacteria bacterium]MCW5741535.1 ABC transporter ATP-binding protein [Alphaproteobacteria bacterium]
MAAITFERVHKAFGAVVALEELDLTIGDGEFVSLLGPSGCGKTTTLRMLAGLEQPTRGSISVGERVVNDLPPGQRDLAMVFQSYALYPHMSVAQNIEYPLRKRGVPRAERQEMVRRTAAQLQLESMLDRKPRQLSGGQQQRVALGRALVRDPAAFLLDEPLSNLDAKLRAHMRAELIELHQRIGKTMVYVTHDQLEAMTMSDRIAVLDQGRLRQYDTPMEIYNRPNSLFVAGFIGTPSMNFIRGRLRQDAGGLVFEAGRLTLQLAPHLVREGVTGDVTMGVRPEDVSLSADGLTAAVKVVEPTGHESIVFFDVAEHAVIARVGPDVQLKPGEAVRLSFSTAKLHFFDGKDGRRLNADRPA